MAKINRVGQRYGRLVVVEEKGKDEKRGYLWLCKCDCGNFKVVPSKTLGSRTKSCGCWLRENQLKAKKTTHKMSKTPIYVEWRSMIDRCSPKYHLSRRYYDRGIKVYDEWKKSFEKFYEYVSKLEHFNEKGYTLDRIDNDGNYEPDNVRWATHKEQQNNKCNNVFIEYMGKTQTMIQWCEELNINYGMVKARHQRGWTVPQLFDKPHKNQYS